MQLGLFGDLEPAAGAAVQPPLPSLQEIEEARYQEWLQTLTPRERKRFLTAVARTEKIGRQQAAKDAAVEKRRSP